MPIDLEQRAAQPPGADASIATTRQIENQVRVLFLLALIVGLVGAYYDNWIVAAGAVTAYGVIGAIVTRHESNIERFADSLYYMGFLFTIWGLFFAFGPLGANLENLSSQTIITQFGIKLITTVIALTFRILLTQFRSTIAEQTEEPEKALMLLVEQMTAEVQKAVHAFRDARDQLLREAQTGIGSIQSEALRNIEEVHKSSSERVERVLGDVRVSIKAVLDQLSEIDVPQDILTRRLDEAAQAIAADITKLRETIHSSSSTLADNLAEGLARVRRSTEHVDAALQALKSYEQLASHATASLHATQGATDAYHEALQRTTKLLGELASVVANLHHSTGQDVSKLRDAMSTTGAEITAIGDRIRSESERFSGALTQSVRILREEIERK